MWATFVGSEHSSPIESPDRILFPAAYAGHNIPMELPLLPEPKQALFVSRRGSDEEGNGSPENPYRTIGFALSQAGPGTLISVNRGTYAEHVVSTVNGTAEAPIVLRARGHVRLTSDGIHGRIFDLRHDYYVVQGFEFLNADVLLWLQGADHTLITGNIFRRAQGECVRFKYHSSYNVFERNVVEDCGREDFSGRGNGKNGEGVYLGTAPEQRQKNPTPEADETNNNVIRNNVFNTRGNECVDIKEGATGNIVEFNDCRGQRDPESAGLNARGEHNTFRYNRTFNNVGAGIRFGGDGADDGVLNEAYGNLIQGNGREAIKVTRLPQGLICGNITRRNRRGLSNQPLIKNPPCAEPLPPPGVQRE